MKIECGITSESSEAINENIKYLNKLGEIDFRCKNENKIVNEIGDEGCKAIFNNSKYLSNLEILNIGGNEE